jgi:two-component system NtrC family sensor kinase
MARSFKAGGGKGAAKARSVKRRAPLKRSTASDIELKEAREQLAATADILKLISQSTFDLQAFLVALVKSAVHLCGADTGIIRRREGEIYPVAATFGLTDQERDYFSHYSVKPDRGSVFGRAILEKRTIHVPDLLADRGLDQDRRKDYAKDVKIRSGLGVPLLREGKAIGVFTLQRREQRPYTEKQIELVETFANQAVIAIENSRLFEEVQAKTRDLSESLQQQTATADVLKVISRSAFDLEPVLATLVASAARLCEAERGMIFLRQDNHFRMATNYGFSPELEAFARANPFPVDSASTTIRAAMSGSTVQAIDVLADETQGWLAREYQRLGGHRTNLGVPLRRDGETIGVFTLTRQVVRPFTGKQIELVQTFADQAVIAIENIRLFNEVQARTEDLRESLQQQTATAEVLKVISRSAFDLETVLRTLVESAARLCEADKGTITRQKDGAFYRAESFGFSREFMDHVRNIPVAPERSSATGRALLEGVAVHIPDVQRDPDYHFDEALRLGNYRTLLAVPMMREGTPIGVVTLTRSEARPFTDKQIELVTTFADQAAIAIENARLFEEVQAKTRDLSEALQQQTATADVLKVISRSAFDLQIVLDTLTESAARLCIADMAAITRQGTDGGYFHATRYNFAPEWTRVSDTVRLYPGRGSLVGRVLLACKAVQIVDVLADPDYAFPEQQRAGGYRTLLGVPLLRSGEPIGVLFLGRKSVEPFADKQIELVQTFADQAVIAIENVRLFDEVQAKTRDLSEALTYQTGSANILNVIASSPTDVQPVLMAIVESACELCEANDAVVLLKDGDHLRFSAHYGPIAINLEKWPISRNWVAGRAFVDRQPVHLRDSLSEEGNEFPDSRELSRHTGTPGIRSILAVPLLRENDAVGSILLRRTEVNPFSDKQIALLQTFADQAVIAIGNARLFDEVQQRTRELAASLDELRMAQDRLVQTEKLASLGQLTAGIAHEIKNPLNFVNNFSALSAELIDELDETLALAPLDQKMRGEVGELTQMLKSNLEKVVQHGKRADSIVKNMLLHSREGSGEQRDADINALLDESLNLAYHGARAEKPGFNITLQRALDPSAGEIELFPQEITRAFLNLISNGFYAASKRQAENGDPDFEPILSATTKNLGNHVEIRIRDNGIGIPAEVKEKIFNPFFTTKPAGEGTGLGLSMSHDIIVKQHGGRIEVDTQPGQFTEFTIILPRAGNIATKQKS